jgi:drug/metabolite transporter (DMT)-like permease
LHVFNGKFVSSIRMKKDLLIAYVALTAVCIIWGTTYFALRIAVLHFPPFLFTAMRQLSAGTLLITFMLVFAKASLPPLKQIFQQAIGGFFMITLGNGLVAWGEMQVPSGIAAIICSLMPVMVILMNLSINREEKPTVPIMLGVAFGLIGIIMIFGENLHEFSNGEYLLSIILIFTAAVCWAGASIWIKKKNTTTNPFLNAGLQMFFGGVWLIPLTLLFDDLSTVQWSGEAAWSLVYLTLIGSIVAYTCFSYALRKLPMTIVSMYAYINPIVAVMLGWLFLDEKLNFKIAVAILITIAGIYIVNRGYQLRDLWRTQVSSE